MLIVNLINVITYCGLFGTAITSIMDNDSSVIMTVLHNNRKYQQQKGLKTASILSSETILNENLLTNENSFENNNNNNNINRNNNSINNNNKYNKFSSNNRNISSRLNSSNGISNKRITIMSMPQKIIKFISIVTGTGGDGNNIQNNTINTVLIKQYNNDGKRIYDYGGNNEYGGGVSNDNIIIRGTRDVTNSDMDEIGWTNINEEVDLTIPLVLSHLQEIGMTDFKLPDMEETISLKPLFITYSAGLFLYNGAFYNIEGISRNGDAMMTYHDKAFQFRLNLIIRKLQFDYHFIVKVMGLSATGTVVGTLEDLLIAGDFSIRDPIIKLNDFQIVKFGNIFVQLHHNRIVQELSGIILTPITNLFKDRITAGITDEMKQQLSDLIAEFSRKDQLGIKKFMSQILSSFTRQKN